MNEKGEELFALSRVFFFLLLCVAWLGQSMRSNWLLNLNKVACSGFKVCALVAKSFFFQSWACARACVCACEGAAGQLNTQELKRTLGNRHLVCTVHWGRGENAARVSFLRRDLWCFFNFYTLEHELGISFFLEPSPHTHSMAPVLNVWCKSCRLKGTCVHFF